MQQNISKGEMIPARKAMLQMALEIGAEGLRSLNSSGTKHAQEGSCAPVVAGQMAFRIL